ncbi:MAG: hypothetical protein DCF31_10570 [Alphaproteobacteria bacterium]|nr:MAG: hypothetical protein DCF31_10570 [Alphaproteobacteria bacterium]
MLGNILGSFNPVTAMIGTALGGPLGAIIAQAMQQVVSQVVQEIIQKAGEQLGLPQQFIDMAQGAAAGSLGDTQGATRNLQEAISGLSDAFQLNGSAAGNFQRQAADTVQNFIDEQASRAARAASDEGAENSGRKSAGVGGARGGSVLMQIALALGQAMDNKIDQMAANAQELGAMGEIDGKNTSQYQELSAEMNALSQEVKIIGEALNNTLKGIGEASSALARRQ